MLNVRFREYQRTHRLWKRGFLRRKNRRESQRKWVLEQPGWTDEQRAQAGRFLRGHRPGRPNCPEVRRVLRRHYEAKRYCYLVRCRARLAKLGNEEGAADKENRP